MASILKSMSACGCIELANIKSDEGDPELSVAAAVANLPQPGVDTSNWSPNAVTYPVIVYSDPHPHKFGLPLTAYIRKHKLGIVSCATNNNSLHPGKQSDTGEDWGKEGRPIKVWTWAMDRKAVMEWAKAHKDVCLSRAVKVKGQNYW